MLKKEVFNNIIASQENINNKQYFCSDEFEEQVVKEMIDIVRNDEKFQEFSKEMMNKIILGESGE